jgi:hypothetical protein
MRVSYEAFIRINDFYRWMPGGKPAGVDEEMANLPLTASPYQYY